MENSSQNSFKMLRAMVGIGLLCGLLIVLTYEGTLARIEKLKAEALKEAIFKVIPGSSISKAFLFHDGTFMEADDKAENVIYAGYDEDGNLMGVAIEASGMGYADVIRILYGYDPESQAVIGFHVLESKETPGLGDKIEKDQRFLDNFKSLDVSLTEDKGEVANEVITVKQGTKTEPWQIDGITGATISSRAIGDIIGKSTAKWVPVIYDNIEVFKQGKQSL